MKSVGNKIDEILKKDLTWNKFIQEHNANISQLTNEIERWVKKPWKKWIYLIKIHKATDEWNRENSKATENL